MKKFDYSFLRTGTLPASLINVLTSIYSLREQNEYRKQRFPDIFTQLQRLAIVQSVKSSNAIEGIVTSDERIQAIVNQNSAPLNHSEAEILGYRNVLAKIHQGYSSLQFNEENILSFHREMLVTVKPTTAGHYKENDNRIVEISPSGEIATRFTPVSAKDTPQAMQQLVLAFLDASKDAAINSLLLIPCVILDFLCIHPFDDGNGRMSRLLTLLLLYQTGFDAGKYISFEEQINLHKGDYYQALKQSSQGWQDNRNDYSFYLQNFLLTLFSCYHELDQRFATVNSQKVTKANRIEATVLNSLLPISKADICKILPDVSPTTVEAVLGKMVKEGKVDKIGSARSIHYLRKQ
jgi:Fic family protein